VAPSIPLPPLTAIPARQEAGPAPLTATPTPAAETRPVVAAPSFPAVPAPVDLAPEHQFPELRPRRQISPLLALRPLPRPTPPPVPAAPAQAAALSEAPPIPTALPPATAPEPEEMTAATGPAPAQAPDSNLFVQPPPRMPARNFVVRAAPGAGGPGGG